MSDKAGMFVRVACTCGRPDVYLKCDQCGRQALFSVDEAGVACQCGATYSHAVCACGENVPAAQLVAVPFEEGPLVASELEIDPVRVGLMVASVVVLLGLGGWWWLG